MKRVLTCAPIVLTALLLTVQLALLPSLQRQLAEEVFARERAATYSMAGALIKTHPELEEELMLLLHEARADLMTGEYPVLERYGYRQDETIDDMRAYRALLERSGIRIVLLAATAALLFVLWAPAARRRSRMQLRAVETAIDGFLTGDYTPDGCRTTVWGNEDLSRVMGLLGQLGKQMRLSQARLEEEQESTKSLVTDISHQLKTPIASLKTCFELYGEADEAEEREEFRQRSTAQIDKLEHLTGALMNISRLETGMIELKPVPCGMHEVLLAATNAIYDRADKKGIVIDLKPFEDFTLQIDRRWTVEAVTNVLDNAVKYSAAGTAIRIRVERLISFARVEIADEGIGVHREERTRVFQRFYRGNHPLVKASEGSGIGLYLTRFILEKQGGGVWIRSGGEKGATFVLQIKL